MCAVQTGNRQPRGRQGASGRSLLVSLSWAHALAAMGYEQFIFIRVVCLTIPASPQLNLIIRCSSDTVEKGVPTNVRVLLNDVYVITGAENISTIFRNEAYSFPSDVSPITSLRNIFALPKPALKVYIADTSGIKREPAPWSDVKPHRRIRLLTFKATASALSGTGLDQINQRFTLNLADLIHKTGCTPEWTELPDLCQFVRTPVFQAAVNSMFGPHLLSLSPNLAHDFWEMDQRVQQLLICFPSWMIPEASKARQRCLEAMKKWHTFAIEHRDDNKGREESSYEPLQGSVYIQQMMKHFSAMEEMTLDAKASNSLGMLFASVSPIIPPFSPYNQCLLTSISV